MVATVAELNTNRLLNVDVALRATALRVTDESVGFVRAVAILSTACKSVYVTPKVVPDVCRYKVPVKPVVSVDATLLADIAGVMLRTDSYDIY